LNLTRLKKGTLCWVLMVGLGLILSGCAQDSMTKKDPFFEKWGTLADESQGHSPTARERVIETPPMGSDEIAETQVMATRERPLPTKRVTLRMHNVDINVILRAMAQAANQNILIKSGVKGQSSIHINNEPWDEAFRGILRTNGLVYTWEGNIIRVMTVEDMELDIKLASTVERRRSQKLVTMIVNVDFAEANKLKESVKELLTKDSAGKPRGSVNVDEHTNALIIQATREDLERIKPMLEKLDKPIPQITIKANIVEATKETARDLGVQWGGIYGNTINRNSYFITPGGSGGTTGTSPLAGSYTPTFGATGIGGQGNAVNFPIDPTKIAAAGGAGSLGLLFGTIGGSFLEMQLQALQRDGKLNILSSPSITTLDSQTAFTENGERVPYVATSTTGGTITQEVKFEDAVLRLEVTPHVIDGKNLKMKIKVKKDEVDTTRTVQGNPYIIKKQTESTLIVQDGETIVISGLTKQRTLGENTGIPGLKDIPGLGWLFAADTQAKSFQEVLVFITPHILKVHIAGEARETQIPAEQPTLPEKPVNSGEAPGK
jgi:type IV pilus assembly protein PilQ